MRRTALIAALLITAATAGCSSSSSSSTSASTSPSASAALHGTETITGTVTGKAAEANNPTFPLTFRGPVATTGTFTPPGGNKVHAVATFKTAVGNMVANATVPSNATPNGPPPKYLGAPCKYGFDITATYVIDGGQSTGKWAGATGSGKVLVVFSAELPKLSDGKCDLANNAQPVSGTSKGTFTSTGPLTIKT